MANIGLLMHGNDVDLSIVARVQNGGERNNGQQRRFPNLMNACWNPSVCETALWG